MKEQTRNLLVGLTVLGALVMFGGLIVLFAGLPEMFQPGWQLRMRFPVSGGVGEGDWVHLAGIRIGKVTSIDFVEGDPRKGVLVVARIEGGRKVPADVRPEIVSSGFGRPIVQLVKGGRKDIPAGSADTEGFLREDWGGVLPGRLAEAGALGKAAESLSRLGDTLQELLSPGPPATAPATGPGQTQPAAAPRGLKAMLAKLDRALEGMAEIFGNEKNQRNLEDALANLAELTADGRETLAAVKNFAEEASAVADEARRTLAGAGEVMIDASRATTQISALARNTDDRIQALSEKLIADAEALSRLLSSLNRLATKIESGEGTAGQLVHDPKLYNSLLEASEKLNGLLKDLRELAEQWKKNGLPVKFVK